MYDVVVVGGGIAGLRAAVAAQARGASVALISRTNPTRSYSVTIQDGMNAALGTGDSADQHAQDTVQAGGYLADQALVAQICSEAPAVVEELDRMGTPFNRSNGAALDLAGSVGSSQARSAFADDMTGHVVTQVLYEQSLKAQVKAYDEWVAVELAMDDGKVIGVVALQLSTGKLESIGAKAVVLATGGPPPPLQPQHRIAPLQRRRHRAGLSGGGGAGRHGDGAVPPLRRQQHPHGPQRTAGGRNSPGLHRRQVGAGRRHRQRRHGAQHGAGHQRR